ncbi:MAG: sulfite exporter TauE/SafE family protein, partial [Rhodanobacteraceae bacterium]|nr:sulfite exporter TauE/SafE family protein [Rhodanobacteraceae bacterium]
MAAETLLLAGMAAFCAGLLDSIVGGGGLIMTPAMVNLFPEFSILQVIATQRTSSIFGTSVAAWNYLKVVKLDRRLVLWTCLAATLCSALGVQFAKRIDGDVLKYV